MGFSGENIVVSPAIADLMANRGIQESEVREVIGTAENGGVKLYSEDEMRFLAKKRLGNFTVYVEYAPHDDAFEVLNVYSHRVSLTEDQK